MTETARAGLSARSPRPPLVMPTNKVTVALPFSKITVEEPRQELIELAAVVAELAALVEAAAPGPEAAQLRLRAQALAARVR